MDVMIVGGLVNATRSLASASATLLIGLFIAALMRFYLGSEATRRLFGSDSLRAMPQSWLLGMLMPVCSIGVIPILREMRRARVSRGAITAFALSAPLFNPLSLLYGLTLSRPYVILGFAVGSLFVVTVLGLLWDRFGKDTAEPESPADPNIIGLGRLGACLSYTCRELFGPSGALALVAVLGVGALGAILPHGALQTSVEQGDVWAPARMALVAIPIYATPMQTIGQLGMMFGHGNSPGAAFCLLILGTGINLGTFVWLGMNYGWRAITLWLGCLMIVVLSIAYAVEKPLIPPGVEPAGHTHAFDVYTNPFVSQASLEGAKKVLNDSVGFSERLSFEIASVLCFLGAILKLWRPQARYDLPINDAKIDGRHPDEMTPDATKKTVGRFDREVPPVAVGITGLLGLLAFSIVACYAYYPSQDECLKQILEARAEVLPDIHQGKIESALRWMAIWEEWSRKLEVGSAIRTFELRPYQQMQGYLLRKKLELLEHELEHEERDDEEIQELIRELSLTSARLSKAFRS